jgi:zinc transport system substrate-binding protein
LASTPGWIVKRALVAAALIALGQSGARAAPDVVVTLKPLHGLVAAVMEGVETPHLLIDGAASPHTYAMKPSEVRRLNKAGVIVRVSKSLEVFLVKPLALVSKQARIITIDEDTPGLTLLPLRTGGDFETHTHSAGEARGHNHDHGHAHETQEHDQADRTGHRPARDPHLWLDPRNAKAVALHLSHVLAEVYPAAATQLESNGRALAERLDALDGTLSAEMAPVAGRPFLVFHDAYRYFEERYGLAATGSVTVNPEVPPSARRISAIRTRVAKARTVCVFAEPQFAPRVIAAIAEGTGVRQATLDPLGASIPAGPGHYFALMNNLARDLKACLGGTG